jgi:hypothetical protein
VKSDRGSAPWKDGSIAVIERALRTLKEALRLTIVPTRRMGMFRELAILVAWYNQHRPHMKLGGKTPDEVYFHRFESDLVFGSGTVDLQHLALQVAPRALTRRTNRYNSYQRPSILP